MKRSGTSAHGRLIDRMAETVGADLSAAVGAGRITLQEYRAAVQGCSQCDEGEACMAWVEAHGGRAEHTPDYCRNRGLLERIKLD